MIFEQVLHPFGQVIFQILLVPANLSTADVYQKSGG